MRNFSRAHTCQLIFFTGTAQANCVWITENFSFSEEDIRRPILSCYLQVESNQREVVDGTEKETKSKHMRTRVFDITAAVIQ